MCSNHQTDMREHSNNVFKSVPVHEVLGFMTQLWMQDPIEIDKQYLDGGGVTN